MTKAEMRRLGLLPYEEGTPAGWMTTRRRRRPQRRRNRNAREINMTIERVEVTAPSRRMTGGWRHVVEDVTEEVINQAAEQIREEVDDDVLRQLTEETGEIHPNRTETQRGWWQRLIRRGN